MSVAEARPIRLLTAGAGLALVALCAWLLAWARPRSVDGEDLLAATFEMSPLPFDLRVAKAVRLPTGERAVILEPPIVEPEPAAAAAAEAPEKPDKPDPSRPRFDWSKIEVGEADRPPRQVWIVWYSGDGASEVLEQQFRNLHWMEARDLGEQGGLLTIDGGKLAWSGFDADYVHLRACESGGTFRDSIRVNLSAAGRRCALHALWTRGLPASKARVEEVLKALSPTTKA